MHRWRFCIFHCRRPPTEGGGGESSTLLCPTAALLFDLFLFVTYHERNLQPLAEGEFCNGTSFCLRQEPVSSYTSIRSGQNNGRQLALSSVIPQGKQNQPCVVNGLVLQVRTYCAHYNIRKTTTNSSTIGNEKDHSLCHPQFHTERITNYGVSLQVRIDVLGPVYITHYQ